MTTYEVCIVGGGAAGLAAAACLDDNIQTCLLEKNAFPGRKIMATGGGRCNITNVECLHRDITLDFFNSLGMELYCDRDGNYYPYSNRAEDVVKVLEREIEKRSVTINTGCHVNDITYDDGVFRISGEYDSHDAFAIEAEKILIATGGKAAPQFGTTGDGYALAKSLGHSVTRIYPILTAIECGDFRDIKGVRAWGTVQLYRDGVRIAEETGEIQFTADGISGICVFNLTREIVADDGERISAALKRYKIALDLAPDFTEDQMNERRESFGILCEKLSGMVDIGHIKNWELPVLGVKGWRNAQCTGGGIVMDEIDENSMESNLVQGLYFAGEILNIQGKCGGFNLQNAWETGIKAAMSINMTKRQKV